MTLQHRRLRDLNVSALGLGCMGMSTGYGQPDDAESLRTLDRALDLGVTFYDTADIYGANEDLLGAWLKGKRDRVVLASKFGFLPPDPARPGPRVNGRPEYMRQAVERSLKRLGTEYIDLYYLHRADPQTPIEDTVGAMAELVREGVVRGLGLSEVSAETLPSAATRWPRRPCARRS